MARYFTRSRVGEIPGEAYEVRFVNRRPLPVDAAHAFTTPAELLQDDDLDVLIVDPSVDLARWEVVEFEADPETAIVPDADEHRAGVFVVPLVVLERTPVLAWIEERARAGSPDGRCRGDPADHGGSRPKSVRDVGSELFPRRVHLAGDPRVALAKAAPEMTSASAPRAWAWRRPCRRRRRLLHERARRRSHAASSPHCASMLSCPTFRGRPWAVSGRSCALIARAP